MKYESFVSGNSGSAVVRASLIAERPSSSAVSHVSSRNQSMIPSIEIARHTGLLRSFACKRAVEDIHLIHIRPSPTTVRNNVGSESCVGFGTFGPLSFMGSNMPPNMKYDQALQAHYSARSA